MLLGQMAAMNISVIVPVLDEAKTIAATLQSLSRFAPFEIIVVDGGSTDRTAEICQQFGVKVMASTPSRARQMNSGAKAARGDILLFLHADTTLPNSAFDDIRLALGDSRFVGGRFDVELDGEHWMLKVIGAMINHRSRLSKVSTGDQAIFVSRFVFEEIGGYPDIPLMEDVAFGRTLRRTGEIACLKSRVMTSARRWEIDGVWRTILRMWALKLLYLAGVSPNRLKQYYADAR
jgi:rSAM/selenodomain-associated transferase 2